MQYYVITAVGIMVKENNDLNDLFEAYKAEENPIKKGLLLGMYNNALQQKQKEVINRGDFVR
ncbi:hypothetical protein [Streptococcus salivarius]|jgi:hypothetical protein|uniref:hypothetical protein n=1 Tax=Streptococcus salivarius TaxID=1304 RepID=UPI0018A9ADA4|nr:hypothetical protein [Streptococcus salivarius]